MPRICSVIFLVRLRIIILIRVVGIVLVIALLTIPSTIARQFINRLKYLMIFSIICAIILTAAGLFLSYYLNLPSGAVIVLLLGLVFSLVFFLKKLIVKK